MFYLSKDQVSLRLKRGGRCDEDITVYVLGSLCSCMHSYESVDDVHVERKRDRAYTRSLYTDIELDREENLVYEIKYYFSFWILFYLATRKMSATYGQLETFKYAAGDAGTLGPRWEAWLEGFKLYLEANEVNDSKGKVLFKLQM
ncbi:hypothetical protein BpHYR1_036458, partial [Brachionus plicatilis]